MNEKYCEQSEYIKGDFVCQRRGKEATFHLILCQKPPMP